MTFGCSSSRIGCQEFGAEYQLLPISPSVSSSAAPVETKDAQDEEAEPSVIEVPPPAGDAEVSEEARAPVRRRPPLQPTRQEYLDHQLTINLAKVTNVSTT